MADIYFWRQLFILCSSLPICLSVGLVIAFPSVLNPAITSKTGNDIKTSGDHASWITATIGVGGLVGSFILPSVMQIFGRKAYTISVNAFHIIGWTIFLLSENVAALYAARFVQGLGTGGVYIHAIVISEYVHPSRRGYFNSLKKAFISIGVLCCHAMSTLFTWRQLPLFGIALTFASLVLTLLWPETPSYLLLKGKLAECEESFKWLHGNSAESQKQLKYFMDAQLHKLAENKFENNNLRELVKKLLKKDFQQACLITLMLIIAGEMCGRHYVSAYIIEIMMTLMDNKTSAYYLTLGVDFFIILAISTSTVLISYFKRRTLLLYSGVSSVFLMLSMSILVYLKSTYTFSPPAVWLVALLILLQSFIASIGIIPLSFAIIGEIFPLEHKGLGSLFSGCTHTFMSTAVLKITPVLMKHAKLYGVYGIFSLILGVCMMILYRNVPETKDKTLQEIEDELNNLRNETNVMERQNLML